MKSFCRTGVTAILVVSLSVFASADQPIGLSKTKPAKGRFVEADNGFMVPYTINIPGTDVRFSMEPVPGGAFTL